ncbi:GAF domain-containing protein [Aggregicoccus sp. 17bor-14]|uniref:GAF domain-containing protein n=1 Tax=Myxococcaceae TaxID=31 RepID=UPI00129C6C2B|nr:MULTISPECIES: GAF domain-containing protein [Myxococcaceae]MBF5044206.1 GAF domain-containing protein [Simulacricoccus sp. 17bor-14]MRI89956.1 GAF domain-containing protein [Aggregicoccus sp. 17bor-14]
MREEAEAMQEPGASAPWRDVRAPLLPLPGEPQERLLALGADALDAAIDAVLEQATRELGAQRGAVLLFGEDGVTALMDRYWSAPGMPAPLRAPFKLPWLYRELRAQRPVVFTRLSQLPVDTAQERATLEATGIRSGIMAPLRSAGRESLGWIGFVTLDAERRWTPSQVVAAHRYGELLAPALLRLRAERERDEELRTYAVLAEISAAFLAAPPQRLLLEGLPAALRILAQHLGAQRGTAWELDAEGTGLRLISQWRDGEAAFPAQSEMARAGAGNLVRRYLRRAAPWCVSHLDELPEGSGEARRVLESWGVGAFLAVPLRTGEREQGWLSFSKLQPGPWPQARVQRMQLMADLVCTALLRARDAERARHAEHEARGTLTLLQAALDALCARVAITDAQGQIVAVNDAWRRFASERAGAPGVGANYLQAWRRARALQPEAGHLLAEVPGLLSGARGELRLTYADPLPSSPRWFQLRVTCFTLTGVPRLVFAHEDVTELKLAEEQLRDLAGELVQVQDTERRRIASVLHDGAAQQVFAAMLGVRAARRSGHSGAQELAECQELLEQALLQLRSLSHLLHPPLLDEAGLGPALSAYVEGFSTRSGLLLTLSGTQGLERLPTETEHALFRMVQEALLNVQRHSGSARASVQVEQDADEVRITVQDQGHGFPAAPLHTRPTVGLASMRQRLLQVGGALELRSGPEGTEVCARVPRRPSTP